jgi:hypothetical protein
VLSAAPGCEGASVRVSSDRAWLIGSARFVGGPGEVEAGSSYRWLTNGAPLAAGLVGEDLLLHFDGNTTGAAGETPSNAINIAYSTGRWGQSLSLPANGQLRFSLADNYHPAEGTIELWAAPRADGTNAAYSTRDHILFHYRALNGDYMQIDQAGSSGVIYAGGSVSNQWQSAYNGSHANMRSWLAGQWHHLAFTWSAAGNFMRFYVDGVLAAENNEGHYWPPAGNGGSFAIGGDLAGTPAFYNLEEFRVLSRVAGAGEIAAHATRLEAPAENEIWLPASMLVPGTQVQFEFTPATAMQTGAVCRSAAVLYTGIPITNAQPPSTLLPPGATTLDLVVQTFTNTTCAWSVGEDLPYPQMTPFAAGAGTSRHQACVTGLSADPNVVNDVFVRCAAQPDYCLRLQYRSLSDVNPPFPRTGNLWGWGQWRSKGLSYCAKVDLWLGASPPPQEIRELRRLNPHLRLLTSVNAVENSGLPEDYYLHDTKGRRIEVWPGSFRLNLTKPYVAEYQARFAYETVLGSGLLADGVFFDNVMTSQSWQTHDIYGNPVQVDADENGLGDDPATFDAAWKAGVFAEIRAFRALMPHAIISGHSMDIYEPGIAELFNGISIGFSTANVLEGEESFASVFQRYHDWRSHAVWPATVMVESSPVDPIAYGYDYEPGSKMPFSTLEFARTYYPWMRFGLALTLMEDGFFAHEFGDTWHGNDWWYDELDFNLGYPLGPAQRIDLEGVSPTNAIVNGGFETGIVSPWNLAVSAGSAATLARDTSAPALGAACARITITAASGIDWHVQFQQLNRALVRGKTYDLSFRARSSAPRAISLSAQKNSPDWRNYGLSGLVTLTTNWAEYTRSFDANETVTDARVQFFLGSTNGTVWFDDVQLTLRPPEVYRRDFTDGIVLLNGTRQPRDVTLEPGFHRFSGTQAAMHEFILDDADPAFTTTGAWTATNYDSGEWMATGPFYHSWAGTIHERSGTGGEARWQLTIDEADTYTLSAWWPAWPGASNWTRAATFDVLTNGIIAATSTLDQSAGGDQWHTIATLPLLAGTNIDVRLSAASGVCLADALHVRSQVRLNNGQPARTVRLAPLDGLLLKRDQRLVPPTRLRADRSPLQMVAITITNLTRGLTNSLLRSTGLGTNPWEPLSTFQASTTSATITDGPATNPATFYRVRTE